jgi:hypothetical protein
VEPAPPGVGAHCATHPAVAAVATCARCGGFLCGDCVEVHDELPYCAPCSTWWRKETRPRLQTTLLMAASTLGLVCSLWAVAPLFLDVGYLLGMENLRLPWFLTSPAVQAVWVLGTGAFGFLHSRHELKRLRFAKASERTTRRVRTLRFLSLMELSVVALGLGLFVYSVFFFRLED